MCVCLREKGSNQGMKIQIDGSHKNPHSPHPPCSSLIPWAPPSFHFVFFFFFYSAAAFPDWWGCAIGLIHHDLARLGIFLSLTLFHSLSCLQPHVLIEPWKKQMSNFLPLVCSPATSLHLSQDLQLKKMKSLNLEQGTVFPFIIFSILHSEEN